MFVYPAVRLLLWAAVLAVLIGGGIYAIFWARRSYLEEADVPDAVPSLDDYRKLLEEGVLGADEFERIRARLQSPTLPEPPEVEAAPSEGIQDRSRREGIQDQARPRSSEPDPPAQPN